MNSRAKGIALPLLAVFAVATISSAARAQLADSATGVPVGASTVPVERGFINLGNGNLHIEIPFTSYKERGALSTNLRMVYDSMIWHGVANGSGSSQWQPNNIPNSMGGWRFASKPQGEFSNGGSSASSPCSGVPAGEDGVIQYGPFYWETVDGTNHTFAITTTEITFPVAGCTDPNFTDTPTASGYAIDGSGLYAVVNNYNEVTVYDQQGTQVASTPDAPTGQYGQIDSNGNYDDGSGDDLGRVLVPSVTTSADGNTTYYNVLTAYGNTEQYSVTTESIPLNTNFLSNSVGSDFQGNMTVVQSIGLPDGSSYNFTYENGTYGELSGITLPQGGTITYVYQSGLSGTRAGETVPPRWVSSHAGSNGTSTFSIIPSKCPGGIGQIGPCPVQDNFVTRNAITTDYHFALQGGTGYLNDFIYYHTGNKNSTVSRTIAKTYLLDTLCPIKICGNSPGYLWPNLATQAEVFNDTSLTKYTSYGYATPATGIPTTVKQWDYYTSSAGSNPPYAPTGAASRETDTTLGYNVHGALLPTLITVSDTSGQLSQTTLSYDDPGHLVSSPITPTHNVSVAGNRGNLTTVKQFLNTNNTQLSTGLYYDGAGALQYSIDPLNNQTTFGYDATDTFITSTLLPPTNGVQHHLQAAYDVSSGQILSQTDQNSQVTNYTYDSLGRLSTVTSPNGNVTTNTYPSPNETDTTDMQSAGVSVPSTNLVDSFGRPSQKTTAGVSSETSYDTFGRLSCVTTPHTTTAAATDGSTCNTLYDLFDRVETIQQPDKNKVTISYTDNLVTTTDEVGAQHKNAYNAFGDLTAVIEQDNQGVLDWETDYQYDGMDRLLRVDQKGNSTSPSNWRTRTFAYDSLGRVANQTTPEGGQLTFNSYDANGNLLMQTDARGLTVQYQYDALNRLTHKVLQNGSTYVYTYDAQDNSSDPFGIGRLTSVQSGTNVGALFTHDVSGNVASERYCLPSDCSYTQQVYAVYDYHGNVESLIYPSGGGLAYDILTGYDLLDRPTSVYDRDGKVRLPYLTNATYYPAGELNTATYGNGVQLSAVFNKRQSVTSLGYSLSGKALWSKAYAWDKNATNLLTVTDKVGGDVRSFTYDHVNRLISANDSVQSGVGTATGSHGSVTISGTENSNLDCSSGPPCTVVWDTGYVMVTVNGVAASADYGQGSTASALAAALTSALNAGNPSITASVSGTTINIVSNSTGGGTNYSLQVYPATSGLGIDFTLAASGAALSGGADATAGGLSDTYSIDAWGNRQESGNLNFLQPFNVANQISATGYGYDLVGNLTTDGLGNTYSYDADGKMSASNGAAYTRDPFGQRVRKDFGGGATEYFYFGGRLLATRDPSTNEYTDYVYNGTRLFAERLVTYRINDGTINETDTPFYRIGDHLDSLAQRTDGAGNVLGTNDLSPYGELITGTGDERLLFTQHERDTENGSDSTVYRQYASTQGRWLSPDPYSGSYNLADPQSLNRYAYLSGRPLSAVDNLGLYDDGGGLGGIFGLLPGLGFGLYELFASGGSHHLGPPSTVDTGYGNPYDTSGSVIFPGYVNQLSSDPGSLGESLGIPLSIPHGVWGIGPALGLPSSSCEFGACGGGPLDATGVAVSSAVPYINLQSWQQLLAHFYPWFWFNKGGSNLVPGTHYCGPGGWGSVDGHVDAACYQHDLCYGGLHIDAAQALAGLVPPSAQSGKAACDQALCQTISRNSNYTPDEMAEQFWVSGYFCH